MSHDAIIERREDPERGVRSVVIHADDIIWISEELIAQAGDPNRGGVTGDLEVDGQPDEGTLLHFGTPGEGLGRLTYEITGWGPCDVEVRWCEAVRVRSDDAELTSPPAPTVHRSDPA